MYSTTNNQTTRKIYDLLDSIQEKLSKSSQVRKTLNKTSYANINYNPPIETQYILRNPQQNITTDNIRYINILPNQSSSFMNNQTTLNNSPSEIDIKKLIKDEFNKLISSHQLDIDNKFNTMENKLNEISNDYSYIKNEQNNLNKQYNYILNNNNSNNDSNKKLNLDVENSLKEIRALLNGFITQDEFGKKYQEILEQINSGKNNNVLETKKLNENYNKLKNDFDNINQKIQEFNINYENIANKFENFYENYNNEINVIKQNNNKILTNEIKLNEINNKNSFIQKKLDEYYQELNDYKNNINLLISSNNEKINEIKNNLSKEKSKENQKNESSLNSIKNINEILNNDLNEIRNEIYQIKEKMKKVDLINIEQINKLDFDKINLLSKECQEIKDNNPKLFEFFEKYDISIKDLNTKLNKLNTDYENETKKRYNQINERLNKFEEGIKDINNNLPNQKLSNIDKGIKINEEDIKQSKNIKKIDNDSGIEIINSQIINSDEENKENINNENENAEKKDEEKPRGNLPIPVDDDKNDNNDDDEFGGFDVDDN